jgi:hypothetical protein
MQGMLDEITKRGLTRDGARAVRRAKINNQTPGASTQSASPYTYSYKAPDRSCKVEIKFRRQQVRPAEVIAALQAAIKSLTDRETPGASDNS